MAQFSHFDTAGNAAMVDVGAKKVTVRKAMATALVTMSLTAYQMVKDGTMGKGDVLAVSRIAGIMAAKKVDALIPLAHPLAIDRVAVDFQFDDHQTAIKIRAEVGCTGKTGVEMEALTAASIAALTIYDMCKSVDKGMIIGNVQLISKSGGKSGTFVADESGSD